MTWTALAAASLVLGAALVVVLALFEIAFFSSSEVAVRVLAEHTDESDSLRESLSDPLVVLVPSRLGLAAVAVASWLVAERASGPFLAAAAPGAFGLAWIALRELPPRDGPAAGSGTRAQARAPMVPSLGAPRRAGRGSAAAGAAPLLPGPGRARRRRHRGGGRGLPPHRRGGGDSGGRRDRHGAGRARTRRHRRPGGHDPAPEGGLASAAAPPSGRPGGSSRKAATTACRSSTRAIVRSES